MRQVWASGLDKASQRWRQIIVKLANIHQGGIWHIEGQLMSNLKVWAAALQGKSKANFSHKSLYLQIVYCLFTLCLCSFVECRLITACTIEETNTKKKDNASHIYEWQRGQLSFCLQLLHVSEPLLNRRHCMTFGPTRFLYMLGSIWWGSRKTIHLVIF